MRPCWVWQWCRRRRRLLSLVVFSAFTVLVVVVYSSANGLPSSSSSGPSRHNDVHSDDSYMSHPSPRFGDIRRNASLSHVKHGISDSSFYQYSASRVKEYNAARSSDDDDFGQEGGYYEEKDSVPRNADDLDTEAEELLPDSDSRRLSETVVRINSAIETVSNRLHVLRDFVKESTDLFSAEGDESDYLFAPCQDPAAPAASAAQSKESYSVYGFVGPFRYLANYKNPCWMEPSNGDIPHVYCVPYFYLVGAPKAGSTDVYKRISMHPEVVKPASKETRWFDRARFKDEPHFMSFLRNFYNASGVIHRSLDRGTNYHRRVVGDGSPSYFFDNRQWPLIPGNEGCSEPRVTVASHIHHLYPQARIIFILRNPVQRLYSSYLYNHAKYEAVSSRLFDQYVREAIQLYNDCFNRDSVRQCANNATVFQQAKVMLSVGLYSVYVRDWLQLFPREQVLIMSTEKYQQNMKDHLMKIFSFLRLRPLDNDELEVILEPDVHNKGHHYSTAGPMLEETRALLQDFYGPYNQELANLLNEPEFLWME